jgi:Nitrogen permease regulator 2
MTIDIFQYSNMYTLRKSIQWLADEVHVREECGPYVTKQGHPIPDWPKLLRLYSRLKPGKTVLEWMESHSVHQLGIDIRRFTSFGVIKVMIFLPQCKSQQSLPGILTKSPSLARSSPARSRFCGCSRQTADFSSPTSRGRRKYCRSIPPFPRLYYSSIPDRCSFQPL